MGAQESGKSRQNRSAKHLWKYRGKINCLNNREGKVVEDKIQYKNIWMDHFT